MPGKAAPATTTPVATAKKKGWSKAAKGTAIGAATGAVAGAIINKKNRVLGGVVGGVLGGGIGYGIGRGMDKKDVVSNSTTCIQLYSNDRKIIIPSKTTTVPAPAGLFCSICKTGSSNVFSGNWRKRQLRHAMPEYIFDMVLEAIKNKPLNLKG